MSSDKQANISQVSKKYMPDAILVTETKLYKTDKLEFASYECIRTDRRARARGGGTAILLKKNIKFKQILIPKLMFTSCLEYTIIKINLQNNKNLILISIYTTHKNEYLFTKELDNLFGTLKLGNNDNLYYVAGDFNARHTCWSNPINNSRGTKLNNWINYNEFRYNLKLYHSEIPSFPQSSTYLDLILADQRLTIINKANDRQVPTIQFHSDHLGLITDINLNDTEYINFEINQETYKYNFSKINLQKFKNFLNSNIDITLSAYENLNNSEIDNGIEILEKGIQKAIEISTPKYKRKNTFDKFINSKIKKLQKSKSFLITEINRFYRQNLNRHSNEFMNLKQLLSEVKREITCEFRRSENSYWEEKIRNIPINVSSETFPQINNIFRKKEISIIPEIIKIPGTKVEVIRNIGLNPDNIDRDTTGNFLITDKDDKLNVMGSHFELIHVQNKDLGTDQFNKKVEKTYSKFKKEVNRDTMSNNSMQNFSIENNALDPTYWNNEYPLTNFNETKNIFRKLNNKKSTGIDGIPNIILKSLPKKIIVYYTIIFNNSLNNRYFPVKWKKAKIIPIPKGDKDPSLLSNLRPISLLPNLGKVFEIIINKRIISATQELDLLPESQFGFRYKHSCIHAVTKLVSDICWALNNNESVGACLVDTEKAFDCVWREGLITKLLKIHHINRDLVKMIFNMIEGRTFVIADKGSESSIVFKVGQGIQQGTVTSPILYNLYASDILKKNGLNNSKGTNALAFADDLIVYTAGSKVYEIKDKLEDLMGRIQFYYNQWKLRINLNKCETILFRPPISKKTGYLAKGKWKKFQIQVNNINIPHKREVKYLGIILDDRLLFNKHLDHKLAKANKAFIALKGLFCNAHIDPRLKILSYCTLIRPIITYGCSIWFNQSASAMEAVRIFERKCLRACTGLYRSPESNYLKYISNSKLYNSAKISRIDCFILNLIRKYYIQVVKITENSLIFGSVYPNEQYFEKTLKTGFIPPEAFIYMDARGLIQDANNVPSLYHLGRNKNNKKISIDPLLDIRNLSNHWRYNKALFKKKWKGEARPEKCWWLDQR